MAIVKSSNEHLTLNADGSGNDIKFQSNGVEKASLTDGGVFTATSFAGSGANLTGISSVGGATGVDFNDDVKARFGASNDLEVYHDGSNSRVKDNGTGDLILQSNGTNVKIWSDTDEDMAKFIKDGGVELYHNNAIRLQTNATGIQLGMDGNLDGGIVSAVHSLFFNIDSDNNSSGQQIRFATNHNSGASGGNTLLSIKEDGRGLSPFTAKAWAYWDGTGTLDVRAAHNISSVSDYGTGWYAPTYANAMSGLNYGVYASGSFNNANRSRSVSGRVQNAGSAEVFSQADNTAIDNADCYVLIFSEST